MWPTAGTLPAKQQQWLIEYLKDLDGVRAARVAGYADPLAASSRLQNVPAIKQLIAIELDKRNKASELDASYVRDYIHTIMEFKPGLYFKPATDGGWMIPDDVYARLPEKIQRLVEEIEVREVSTGEGAATKTARYYWVKFVSKTSAMVQAAKYTLTQQVQLQAAPLDFDTVLREIIRKRSERSIEAKIEGVKPLPIEDKSAATPSSNGKVH